MNAQSKRPDSEVVSNTPRVHTEQPVDPEARRLAQGRARPACWKDLYWHLIGSRHLQTDEEKVRAIFTWLCSAPPDMNPFASLGVEEIDASGKSKSKEKCPIDSPDVVLPKLVEGKANYVQVSSRCSNFCIFSSIVIYMCTDVCSHVISARHTSNRDFHNIKL